MLSMTIGMVREPTTNAKHLSKMTIAEQQAVLEQLKSEYRVILVNYFTADETLQELIDKFINALFCANIPVPQIIEMHMEIIDEFSKQLKLEGRSDEALLDYRLTLIDILAHLCEAYRGSVPK
jgi:KaiA C-terminal domain